MDTEFTTITYAYNPDTCKWSIKGGAEVDDALQAKLFDVAGNMRGRVEIKERVKP